MKQRNFLIGMLAMILALSIAPGVMAKNKGSKKNKGKSKQMEMLRELELTDKQKEEIRDLTKKSFVEIGKLRLKEKRLRKELELLVTADKWNETQVNSKIDQLTAIKGQMMKKKIKFSREIRKLLTPEQQVIWDLSGAGTGKGLAKRLHKRLEDRGRRSNKGGRGYGMGNPGGPGDTMPPMESPSTY